MKEAVVPLINDASEHLTTLALEVNSGNIVSSDTATMQAFAGLAELASIVQKMTDALYAAVPDFAAAHEATRRALAHREAPAEAAD